MSDAHASHAEQLDPSKLGEEVGDDGRAADDFPPDEPLGVDDPSILSDGSIADDDYRTRDDRHVDEREPPDEAARPAALLDPGVDPDVIDDEQQLIADTGDRHLSRSSSRTRRRDERRHTRHGLNHVRPTTPAPTRPLHQHECTSTTQETR